MQIGVLGPLVVDGDAVRLAPRDRVVLAALTLRPGELVAADQLADALWVNAPPATWSKVVQGSIVRLRKVLGPAAIETLPRGYRLVLPAHELDAREFERLLGRAREQLTLGESERASYTLSAALDLWRGRALVDLDGWDAGRVEAGRLDELRRDAEELRVDAALRAGRHRQVLAEARTLVEAAPLRERRWELLALAQYQAGHQGDALRTLREVTKVLLDELGLDPSHDLGALEQAILRQDPALLAGVAPGEPSATCPYLGLVPYDVEDAEAFFGRDADVTAGLQRLAVAGVLTVVGPSGSGKSSLVRAGVAATLRRDGSRVVVINPGKRPMEALTALPPPGRPTVLVVDQCEEALFLCEDPTERASFFAALCSHAHTGLLVIALRADRLGDVAAYTDFARLVERGLYLLNPMSEEGLRATVEGPARQAGLALDPGLVELLVAEVLRQPGALPLLSHVLRQTWALREGATLTVDGYRATGGVRHAVTQTAESLYQQVAPEQRPMLRDLLLRLVTSGPEGEPVRNRVPRRLVAADAEHDHLVEQLVRARLVTSDDGQIELAHEAVARAWPRLRGWLDEDSEGQRILRHLTLAADTWHTMGRPESELYRGTRLAQALDWWADSTPDLTDTEQAFLEEGRRLAETEEHTAAQQTRAQARTNRRLRGLLAGGAFLLIAVVIAGTLAVGQANRATDATRAADAQRVTTQSQLANRIDQSLLLALASLRLDPSAGGRAGLLAALARHPQLTSFIPAADQPFWHLDVRPDGDTVAVMDFAGRVRTYDTQSMERIGVFDPHPPGWATQVACVCDPVAFSPDGEELAVADLTLAQPSVRLLDAQSHLPVDRQLGGLPTSAVPVDLDYSADGHFLAVTFDRYQPEPLAFVGAFAHVWDLRRPAAPLAKVPQVGYAPSAELSPDGSLLYTVPGWNNVVPPVTRVFDVATGRQLRSLGALGHPLTLSPDGSTIAYADGSDVVVSDAVTGQQQHVLQGHQGALLQVRFSDDGELVASVSDDQTAMVWETSTGRVRERLQLGTGSFPDVRFSAEGQRLLATVEEGLMTFDLDGSNSFIRRTAPPDPIAYPEGSTSRFVSPDGDAIAVSVYDTKIQAARMHLLDLQTGRRVLLGVDFNDVAWRPDGRRLAVSQGDSGRIRVLDTASGEVIEQPFRGVADDLMYSSDGNRLLANTDGGITLLDAETLRPLTEPVRLEDRSTSLTGFGPTNSIAVVTTGHNPRAALDFTQTQGWALLNLHSGQVIREGQLSGSPASAAMSPDRDRAAFALGGRVEIVDLSTGQSRVSPDIGVETESEGQHLAYSMDGALLVSADNTGRVSLWNGRTAELLGTVAPSNEMSTPGFLTDDRTVLLAAWDGAVYEWDTDINHAINFACDVIGHGLTQIQWQQLLPNHAFKPICPTGATS